MPVVGDWSGNGITKVGLYRPSNGLFLLDKNGNFAWDGPAADRALYFAPALNGPSVTTRAQPGDLPLTGSWAPTYTPAAAGLTVGQGLVRTGIYRPSTGTFFLDATGDGTYQGRAFLGGSGDVPVGIPIFISGSVAGISAMGNQ